MEIEVRLVVHGDDGSPVLSALRSESVIGVAGDIEGNILKCVARLGELTQDAGESVQRQALALREEDARSS